MTERKTYKDLTLVTCSYNTPEITYTMLRSFRSVHSHIHFMNLLVIENSTNEQTVNILDENGIGYIRNPGGTHSPSIDLAFEHCKTKYALVVDTDIIFRQRIDDIYKRVLGSELTLCGIECGDRAGYKLMERIHPWFMFVNVEEVKKAGIKFHDDVRIKATNSEAFFGNVPLNPNKTEKMYDVGSTFYEDIKNEGLKIGRMHQNQPWFVHYEGSSWQRQSGDELHEVLGNRVWNNYQTQIHRLKNIDIKNYYIGV